MTPQADRAPPQDFEDAIPASLLPPTPIGHNGAPADLPQDEDTLKARLEREGAKALAELDRIERKPIPEAVSDEQQAGALADFLKSIGSCEKDFEALHKKQKEPYLGLGRFVDGWKNAKVARLAAVKARASVPLLDFQKRKDEQRRKELAERAERERLAALETQKEAEAHRAEGIDDTAADLEQIAATQVQKAAAIDNYAATAKSSDIAKTRTAAGTSASIKAPWVAEIEALPLVDLETLRPYFTPADIEKAARGFVKAGGRECAGLRIFQQEKLSVR